MAKHLAGPDHPAFQVTDADRARPARHRKEGKPRLSLLLNDVVKPEQIAKAS